MSDPLALLREYHTKKLPIRWENGKISFGSHEFPANTKTAYHSMKGSGPPYQLDALVFFLQHHSKPFAFYVKECQKSKIQSVAIQDRKNVLDYLSSAIDWTQEISSAIPTEPEIKIEETKEEVVEKEDQPLEFYLKRERLFATRESILITPRRDFTQILEMLDTAMRQKRPQEQHMDTPTPTTPRAAPQPRGGVPIIVVPSALTSLLTIYNAKEFLQQALFVPSVTMRDRLKEQQREEGAARVEPPSVMYIERASHHDDTKTVRYEIIDQVKNLSPKDWNRVVAVFATGAQWQFDDWKWREPALIFENVCGFHLHWDDEKLNDNIRNWRVHRLGISKNKRYTDKVVVFEFWKLLSNFIGSHATKRLLDY